MMPMFNLSSGVIPNMTIYNWMEKQCVNTMILVQGNVAIVVQRYLQITYRTQIYWLYHSRQTMMICKALVFDSIGQQYQVNSTLYVS